MLLVVDANIVFAALLNKGNSFKVFEANKLFKQFEFISPEFLFSEIGKRFDKILLQSKLSKEELSAVFSFIKLQINPIQNSEFIDKIQEAGALNIKDSPYLALAMKSNCAIFSGDKKLKNQSKVKVFSPRDLLTMLGI